jgi:predicted  nucleic acid-binding Zn-ribbon protein
MNNNQITKRKFNTDINQRQLKAQKLNQLHHQPFKLNGHDHQLDDASSNILRSPRTYIREEDMMNHEQMTIFVSDCIQKDENLSDLPHSGEALKKLEVDLQEFSNDLNGRINNIDDQIANLQKEKDSLQSSVDRVTTVYNEGINDMKLVRTGLINEREERKRKQYEDAKRTVDALKQKALAS